MKKSFAFFVGLALLAIPAVSFAATLSGLQAQLQSLLSQVSAVQEQIAALQSSTGTSTETGAPSFATTTPRMPSKGCPVFLYSLERGSTDATTNGEVSALQQFLAQYPSIYPQGLVTGFFGSSTAEALGHFQEQLGVLPSATSTGFGLFGPVTRSGIAKWCGVKPPMPPGGGGTSTPPACTGSGPVNPDCIGVTNPVTGISSISIDRSSLVSTTSAPTITGEAQNLESLIFTVDGGDSVIFENNSVSVTNGIWSVTTTPLLDGAYKVTARSTAGNAVASGYLVVSTSTTVPGTSLSMTGTSSLPSVTGVPPNPPSGVTPPGVSSTITPVYSFPASNGTPEVSVTANGSTRGASVLVAGRALIAWNATHSSSCSISSSNSNTLSGSVPTFSSGTQTGPLGGTTTFTLTCAGSRGVATGSVTVSVQTPSSNQPNQVFTPGIVPGTGSSTTSGAILGH